MACRLCDLPVEGDGITADGVEGAFCCPGCRDVFLTLGDVDVDAERERHTESFEPPDGSETCYLAVDGMHCSTCELYLEGTAERDSGVYRADASYATETVRVVYDPEETTPDAVTSSLSRLGYTARGRDEADDSGPDSASRLLIGGIFGMMAMTWYIFFLYPTYFGFDPPVTLGTFDGLYVYSQIAVVTTVVLLYTGRPMLRGAYISLRTRQPNVDLLVSIAAVAAYLYSTGRLLVGGTDLYYDVTLVVVLAVSVGTYYESQIKHRTAGLLADLTELQVDDATREDGETVPITDLAAGERVLVNPGERVPVDGTVVEGRAAVDEALVTGESLPVSKQPGDDVRGGTVVTDSPLVVTVGDEAESTLDRVVDLLWEIQAARPGAQRLADRLATVFVPLVLVLAAVVGTLLFLTGTAPRDALLASLAVLIVSCPCALGLATPLAVASGLQSAVRRDIVVTTPALFEHGDDIETVVFDKTGTLTDGKMAVTELTATGASETELLAYASAVERHSGHPIGAAIVAAADQRELTTKADVESVQKQTRGIAATVDEQYTSVGHPDLLRETHTVSDQLERAISRARERGDVPVVVGWDGTAHGVIAVGDSFRPEWETVLEAVRTDREVVVLTGDDGPVVDGLRDHPAIDQVFAGVPPDAKAETVRRLTATGTVAMVGDGSNDAPALAAADLGIALAGGTKLAGDAADAVVLDSRFDRVPDVFSVAGATRRRIRENLAWAFVYNGVAIPLAIAGLINPLFAALAMATSSLLVVANSARDPLPDEGGKETERHEPETPTERANRTTPA